MPFEFDKFSQHGVSYQDFNQLLVALDSPHLRLNSVLIGGTNGKGSVATYTANLCHQSGKRVGLFLSPHVQHFNERFSIDGDRIDVATFDLLATKIASRIHNVFKLNYFQFLTLVAWHYFIEENVDLAVLEVGLGGRLDPTNISAPLASAISSIDLDHMDKLGNSLEAIFFEKMAISRYHRPMVFGAKQDNLKEMALCWGEQNDIPVIFPAALGLSLPLSQRDNLSVAATLSEQILRQSLPNKAMLWAINETNLPGRQQLLGNFIIDMAHNDSAIQALLVDQKRLFQNIIVAQPLQHPWTTAYRNLSLAGKQIICPHSIDASIDSSGRHGDYFLAAPKLVENFINSYERLAITTTATLQEAIELCRDESTLIVGSARLAGAALDLLCVDTNRTPLYS